MTCTTFLSGDLVGMITFALTNSQVQVYIAIYTFVAYIAISVHMNVVRRFGGVTAVLLATGRKGMTLVLSFVLFPKAFSWFYVTGALLVLGGLLLSSLVKIRQKQKRNVKINRKDSDALPLISSSAAALNGGDQHHFEDLELHATGGGDHHHNNNETGADGLEMMDRLVVESSMSSPSHGRQRSQEGKAKGTLFARSRHDHQQ